MTFAQIVAAITGHCGLSSVEATTRVGSSVNRHYRRITASLNLNAARFVTRSVSTTNGQQYVTFTEIEKIDRILDVTDSTNLRLLTEVEIHQQRSTQPSESAPNTWALRNTDADSVTVLLDTLPQSTFALQADGWTTLSDLSGSDEPLFPESYHDILTWFVIAEELLRKEKDRLASAFESKANALLSELRHWLADSPTALVQQGSSTLTASATAGSGSGSGNLGGTAYTQSALLTFDLGAGVAPFAVARSDAAVVTNLDADKLDGQHGSYYTNASNLASGTVPLARLSGITNTEIANAAAIAYSKLNLALGIVNADVNAAAAIAWTKISKSGSSLADLATRSASDLSSGTVAEARLGSGTGTVNKVLRGNNTWGDPPGITTDGSSAIQQIAFAASQSASVNANTLDDYEEGTWTPGVSFGGGTTGITYGSQTGRYVKIGKNVWVSGGFTLTSKGSSTGTSRLTGLPFAEGDGAAPGLYVSAYTAVTGIAGGAMALVDASATTATFEQNASGGSTTIPDTAFQNTTSIAVAGWYRAAS